MKIRKSKFALIVSVICLSVLVACSTLAENSSNVTSTTSTDIVTEENAGIKKIALVTNQPIDSEEWLKNLVVGLAEWESENSQYDVKIVEAVSVDEYYPKISAVAEAGYDLIITMYSDQAEATIRCAEEYPEIMFGTLDSQIDDIQNYQNIQDFRLNRTQTSFLQGCVAALMTETGNVGFIGGKEVASINQLLAGWQQGIQYINPDINDYVAFANSFTDPTTGKEYALSLIAEGVDVIYAAAGGTGTGVAQAAEENGIMFAACDVHYPDVAPNTELGSTLFFFENMVISFIEDAVSGNYSPGTSIEYGVAEDAGQYEFATSNTLVPDDVKARIEEIMELIASGEIVIDENPLHK